MSEVDGRLEDAVCHLMVGLLIAGFDVKQAQVDVIHHVIGVARTEESGRVEAGMHSHLLGGMEHAGHESRLHRGFAAGESDAAAGGLE